MGKRSGIFILAALPLCFCNGFVSCAYGQSFVFGPEFFSSESGRPQRAVKSFSVQDTSREYILSVQSQWSSDTRGGRSSIDINREFFVSRDELLRKPKVFKESLTLQKQNDISIEVTAKADAPVLVTIMSVEEHAATIKIPPVGGTADLAGYASAVFPAGTFDGVQDVNISATASPSTQNIFEINAAGPRLPYEIRINTGDAAPKNDIKVRVSYPDSFSSPDYQIHLFAQMHDNPDAPGVHDRFFMVSSVPDDVAKTAMTTLPKYAFSNRYGKNGTYEAIITIGLIR